MALRRFHIVHTHIPSSMKIDLGVQAMLRFHLRNLRDCNVGITEGGIYELRH
jgi:hypothetical protein